MKQTAVEKMIQYFIKQKNNGASHWCIDDLIAQLHQAKEMEREQIVIAEIETLRVIEKYGISSIEPLINELKNQIETFKSE